MIGEASMGTRSADAPAAAAQPAGRGDGASIVSVSGVYWSGSGAVVDMLSEHRHCRVADSEFALFSYGQFFAEVVEPLATGAAVDAGAYDGNLLRFREYNRKELLYPLRPVLRRVFAALGLRPARLNTFRAGLAAKHGPAYAQACRRLLAEIEYTRRNGPERGRGRMQAAVRGILADVTGRIPGREGQPFRAAVLDQFVAPAYASAALEACPGLKLIFVDRDWRDQYVEVRNVLPAMTAGHRAVGVRPSGEAAEDYGLDSVGFFVNLRRRVAAIKAAHARKHPDQVLWLRLEDIVLDHRATALRVFDYLGLDPDAWEPGTFLVPEKSRKNLGKWKASPWQDEIARIAEAVGRPD